MSEVVVVRADEEAPEWWDASVAAPEEAAGLLAEGWRGGRLVVFLPGAGRENAADIVLDSADGVTAALRELGTGARRAGGERDVPLPVWRTASFQRWHTAQRAAGNTLLGARLVWTFGGQIFYWALHVRMHVTAEDRVKDNEVVLARPDMSVVALYRRGRSPDDTVVVLVREFRSAATTPDGAVHELPGGSGPGAPRAQAVAEVAEETGLTIDAARLRAHGSRQIAAAMSAHHVHLFSAELTDAELRRLRAESTRPHGVAGDSERTWVEITTYGEIRRGGLVDWGTLGMLAEALGAPPDV